ncbi:phytanoyl-CoA dioxygenase family protein [Talaromyces proteolyticus]|uniref:Phytanoyl-CoA dioxygenase family protein n=1 Tax=Talaromyces proteolyticus TaxID=1131652 RepID=A0AAD4PXZ4_9EURO|nr:phytanoyl-CoA dioxygenase family protein [Talaromyces proteolyticus]KAH8693864.1 phytanoyl-CoA dioxygenase family protein [Talaromyces proteolyticus]
MSTVDADGLTPEQLQSFNDNGFLVIPNYLSAAEVQSLLSTTHSLLDSFSLDTHPMTRFTTGDDDEKTKHVGDDYFLSSGNKIHFFFEPDAVAPPTSSEGAPRLLKPKNLAINKIGHALHSLSPPFAAVTISARNAAIAKSLGFRDPRCLQSMVICKQPGIGGSVPPHRDSEFLYTSPPSAVGWWIALQDATTGNAALGMARGSHRGRRGGHIVRRFVRAEGGTTFITNDGQQLPKGQEEEKEMEGGGEEGGFEVLDVKAGDLVLIHGNVLHESQRNTSEKSRYAYTFHVIEGAEGWTYDERNWLQPPAEGFSRLNDAVE